MKNRTAVAGACAVLACLPSLTLAATDAYSQFPARPVRMIIPTAAGGTVDLVARVVGERLSTRWGQTIVADNRAGANGLIALTAVARAAPDGYTLTLVNAGFLHTAQTSGKLSERGTDFAPIARSAISPLLLVMTATVSAKSVKELVELARAKPGFFNYASGATGAVTHIAVAYFASVAGIELTHVPYKGLSVAFPDLLSGQVHLALTGPSSVMPYVQSGRMRGLAITGAKRLPSIPDIPTFAEAGYPRYDMSAWYGVFSPAGIPSALLAKLNADFNWTMQQPDVVDRLASAGVESAAGLSPTQFADYVAAETITWNKALKAAGLH